MDLKKDQRLWFAAAALWGASEATFFFIVPDVMLTASVLVLGLAVAARLCLVAALGAIAGGAAMYLWGASDGESARVFLGAVPLIGEDLLTRVRGEIDGFWPGALTLGAVTGAPFKIYAVEAGAAGVNKAAFIAVGFFARSFRFLLAVGGTAIAFALLSRMGRAHWRGPAWALFWTAMYIAYSAARLTIS